MPGEDAAWGKGEAEGAPVGIGEGVAEPGIQPSPFLGVVRDPTQAALAFDAPHPAQCGRMGPDRVKQPVARPAGSGVGDGPRDVNHAVRAPHERHEVAQWGEFTVGAALRVPSFHGKRRTVAQFDQVVLRLDRQRPSQPLRVKTVSDMIGIAPRIHIHERPARVFGVRNRVRLLVLASMAEG